MAQQQPFFSPILPFKGCIQGGLHEGKIITVAGRVLAGSERFHVNFQCGSSGNADIALHFNPRYKHQNVAVCNTLQHAKWGTEERKGPVPMPQGTDFTLMFLVNRDSYSVIVNGAHFMEYKHRISATRVDTIAICGGVEVHSIGFQNPASPPPQPGYPGFQQQPRWRRRNQSRQSKSPKIPPPQSCNPTQAYPPAYCAPGFPPMATPPPYSPQASYVVPYKNIVPGGLYPGRNITITGLVNHNANRFVVNLRFNSGIALHFNPRFNENVVVRNSLLKEMWGSEERTGGMPFHRGQPFMITIACDTQCFKIFLNGAQVFSYNHRHFLLQQIDILEVEGDVSLSSVVV